MFRFRNTILALTALAAAASAVSQNITITNARLVLGTGQIIDQGSIVVRDGRIASVAPGPVPSGKRNQTGSGGQVIDGSGMTVMAGFIDDHRHILQQPGPSPIGPAGIDTVEGFLANGASDAMRDLLEAGFTTVQAGGDDPAGILKLKQLVDSGQIKGPRVLTCAPVPTVRFKSEDEVRAAIDHAKQSGADSICEDVYPMVPWPFNPSEQEQKNFAAGAAEAKKIGILFQVHAVSPPAMVSAVRLGATRFVHSVHYDWFTPEQAHEIRDAGAIVASSTNVPGAVYDVFSHDNQPHYRSGKPWPAGDAGGEAQGRSAAFMPLNLRTLFDNGVEIGLSLDAFPYSTHTPYQQESVFNQELKTLNLLFSPTDIIKILGSGSADFLNLGADRGTLETGKLGDLVILGGNPLEGYWNLLHPLVVIKGGQIMVDKRAAHATHAG